MAAHRFGASVLAALVAAGTLSGALARAVPASASDLAPQAGAAQDGSSLAAQESAVVMRIAELSDRVDRTQSSLVDAELSHAAAVSAYRHLRQAVVGMAVQAYMNDSPLADPPASAPAPYADVAASAADRLVARYAAESRRFASDQASYERSLGGLHADQAGLEAQEQALSVLVSASAAAAERRRSADAAALAASDLARRQASPGWAGNSDHAAATAAQAAILARFPFGPLAVQSGTPVLPSALRPVGASESGIASWYGPGFDGQPTASGAVYDENAWTVASPDLPLGTILVVSSGGRSVLLLVNDRGPYVAGRILDLSHAAAAALGFDGLAPVTAQPVAPDA